MRYNDINIGNSIEMRMNELGLNKSELARKIGISNQYVNRLLSKKSIDIDKLIEISRALNFDFLKLYMVDTTTGNEITKTKSSVNEELIKLRTENALLRDLLDEAMEKLRNGAIQEEKGAVGGKVA